MGVCAGMHRCVRVRFAHRRESPRGGWSTAHALTISLPNSIDIVAEWFPYLTMSWKADAILWQALHDAGLGLVASAVARAATTRNVVKDMIE